MALFGTDGVRGLANGPLTADLALTLAQATAVVLGQGRIASARKAAGKRLTAVVARDPRAPPSAQGAAPHPASARITRRPANPPARRRARAAISGTTFDVDLPFTIGTPSASRQSMAPADASEKHTLR